MKNKSAASLFLISCTAALCFAQETAGALQNGFDSVPEPENLANVTLKLVRYHDFGTYGFQIHEIVSQAEAYLQSRIHAPGKQQKLAAIFDIDETALSNWEVMNGCGFCSYDAQQKLYPNATGTAIVPILELFKQAKSLNIAAYFLTGRTESQRAATISNLRAEGYSDWAGLLMRPDGNKDAASVFKSSERQKLTDSGYTIVLNIGDQASDLAGCCAERSFKLPNPFYLVP